MEKENWIVIYQGRHKGNQSKSSFPQTKKQATALFDIHDDAKYLVKIKRRKNAKPKT